MLCEDPFLASAQRNHSRSKSSVCAGSSRREVTAKSTSPRIGVASYAVKNWSRSVFFISSSRRVGEACIVIVLCSNCVAGVLGVHCKRKVLFADAEAVEDVVEDFGGGYFAGDGAEVVECVADVDYYEVGGGVVLQ